MNGEPTRVDTDPDAASGTAPAPDCTLVIFGAGGDLTRRLLVPALYNLEGSGLLGPGTEVIGIDRAPGTDESWRADLTHALHGFAGDPGAEFHVDAIDEACWARLAARLRYVSADFARPDTFARLAERLGAAGGRPRPAIFYLAVPARFFGPLADALGAAGLLREAAGSFRHLVVEKPFGEDLDSAKALNARLLRVAAEQQIFRIDHFLGKETVQSILAVRFSNGLFEPTWRREYVDHVQFVVDETIGVEGRGRFYEPTGALRDMVPNHLFQLLATVAMEPPATFAAEDVRDEKAKLLRAVQPVAPGDAVRGQYGAGTVLGQPVPAYRDEPEVAADSRTETFAALKLGIDNWRWAGVPFYLRTGKRLRARRTEISVHFKPAPYRLFRDTLVGELVPNILTLGIDPWQGMRMQFGAKVPGPQMRLGGVSSSFRYGDFFREKPNVGYETLLYDCMTGDATLFQRADTIEAGWAAVRPTLDAWTAGKGPVDTYPAGSDGPAAADALLARDGRRWDPAAPD